MVRFSDILKKQKGIEKQKPPSEEKKEKTESSYVEELRLAKILKEPPPERQRPSPKIAKSLKETQSDKEISQNLYERAKEVLSESFQSILSLKQPSLDNLQEIISKIVDRISLKDKAFLSLVNEEFKEEEYLIVHSLNVMILSLEIGIGLGYNKSRLRELALGAVLHDIGMLTLKDIYSQKKKLSSQDRSQIEKHPFLGVEALKNIEGISENVISIIKQEHERVNGKGYPEGLNKNEIHEYAKIVAISDVYEALTHPRPYRRAFAPHEAVREIIKTDSKLFDPRILKVLLNRIGVYPIGSWVQLNTGEVGKVIDIDPNFPLRSTVIILFDSQHKSLEKMKTINLVMQPTLYIKRPLSNEELKGIIKGGELE